MTTHPTAVAIARAEDILVEARNCVNLICLATRGLDEKTAPLQYVANIAIDKIDEALGKLDDCRKEFP
jgi:hypothetical protein